MPHFDVMHLAAVIVGSTTEYKNGYDYGDGVPVHCRSYTRRQLESAKEYYQHVVSNPDYIGVKFKIRNAKLTICPLTIK